uniref:Envelope protein n=1 Tax=Falco tinnunculus TaxID=100819 RepID=A0A8C4UKF7_FALTI
MRRLKVEEQEQQERGKAKESSVQDREHKGRLAELEKEQGQKEKDWISAKWLQEAIRQGEDRLSRIDKAGDNTQTWCQREQPPSYLDVAIPPSSSSDEEKDSKKCDNAASNELPDVDWLPRHISPRGARSRTHSALLDKEDKGTVYRTNKGRTLTDIQQGKGGIRSFLALLLVLVSLVNGDRLYNWTLIQLQESRILQSIVTPGAPSFNVTVCQLMGPDLLDGWRAPNCASNSSRWDTGGRNTYRCPSSNPGRSYCNSPGYFYCAYWGCETIATAWTLSQPDRFLTVMWGPFGCKTPSKTDGGTVWHRGNCRYLWINVTNPSNPVLIGAPLLKEPPRYTPQPQPLGPNVVISGLLPPQTCTPDTTPEATDPYPLWSMMQMMYLTLNESNPNLTNPCWLCYDIKSPFYEGIAWNGTYNLSTEDNPGSSKWEKSSIGLMMSAIRGEGTCLGQVKRSWVSLCAYNISQQPFSGNVKWIIPEEGGWWICSRKGLVPCVSLELFNNITDFCIQVLVMPRILYHPSEDTYAHWEKQPSPVRVKREPITAITVATLMALGITGTATGITSLDLERLERSISALEKSLSLLLEVVVQNRRGLVLLFLQQGGFRAALQEECCYADHTRIARDSLAKLHEGLLQHKRELEPITLVPSLHFKCHVMPLAELVTPDALFQAKHFHLGTQIVTCVC